MSRRAIGTLVALVGLLTVAVSFWYLVLDGAPVAWQARAAWLSGVIAGVLVAAIGGATLDD